MRSLFLTIFIAFIATLTFSATSHAQISSVVEVERLGFSTEESATKARKDITDKIVNDVALEYLLEMIGEPKYQKYKSLIDAKILKDKARFIPTIKTGRISQQQDQFQMMVALKVSVQNLKALLLEHGLLYSRDGQPVIMPFIEVRDNVHNLKYKWWASVDSNDFEISKRTAASIERALKSQLAESGFYSSRPSSNQFQELLPLSLKKEVPIESSFDFFSTFYNFDIYIDGHLTVDSNPAKPNGYLVVLKWVAKYQNTHRVIAEVSRSFETQAGDFDVVLANAMNISLDVAARDLTKQLLDSWQKGTFGASLFTLTINGKLEYQQLNNFKKHLMTNAKLIKRVRERRFTSSSVTLEADVTGDASGLHQLLNQSSVDGVQLKVLEMGSSKAVVEVVRPTFQ